MPMHSTCCTHDAKKVSIQPAREEEASAIAEILRTSLGYPNVADEQVAAHLRHKQEGEWILSARIGELTVGVIHLLRYPALYEAPSLEVVALAVANGMQNQGIGALLLQVAEDVCRQLGCTSMRVTSNLRREDAKRFYERNGYHHKKTSRIFDKPCVD